MIYLLLLFLPPLIVVIATKWRCGSTITAAEMAGQAAIALLVIASVWGISRYSAMHDTEILNGRVVAKEQKWVSCSHDYECNCRTTTSGTGSNRTTTRTCDTCYDHANDWNWEVSTTVGDFNIDRIDRRGSHQPPRWSIVRIGEPAAVEHSYVNYIRAAPESILRTSVGSKLYKGALPKYPEVYDYNRVDHVVASGVTVPNLALWNARAADSLRDMGKTKQVNYVVVLTNGQPVVADALRRQWLGGKKNDVIIVIGTKYPAVNWVRVFSWSKRDAVNVELRNAILEAKTLDPNKTVDTISRTIMENYERRPMAEFKYLAEEATPPLWVMILALVLGLGASIGAGIFFHRNDTTCGSSRPTKFRNRRF